MLVNAFLALGIFTFGKWFLKTLRVLFHTFAWRGKSLKKYGANNGNWAVVTGATDGIGKEFALQLAKAGFNIVLVSRSEEKLKQMSAEIGSTYSKDTKFYAIDFASPSESQYDGLAKLFDSLDITVLVNNVGRSHEFPVSFLECDLSEQQAIIDINISATLRVTKLALGGMVKRRKGLILTLSSFAGVIPSPLLATYSASKAFLQTWSDALQSELATSGVDVECVNTYFVVSNMSRIRKASVMIPAPNAYVSSVLRKIGLSCGAYGTGRPSTSTPYWSHSLLDYVIHVIGWREAFIQYTNNLHQGIRKRALRKKERENKLQ